MIAGTGLGRQAARARIRRCSGPHGPVEFVTQRPPGTCIPCFNYYAELLVFRNLSMELTKSLNQDLVKHLQQQAPLLAGPETTVREAIRLLQENKTGCLIVCDPSGKAVGIFTERDVFRHVIGQRIEVDSPIREVMSTDLAAVQETDPITQAIRLLYERGLRHLPVLNDGGEPTGVVPVRRMMEYVVEHFPQTVYNLPPDPSQVLDGREGA